jgi:hypothetical protein
VAAKKKEPGDAMEHEEDPSDGIELCDLRTCVAEVIADAGGAPHVSTEVDTARGAFIARDLEVRLKRVLTRVLAHEDASPPPPGRVRVRIRALQEMCVVGEVELNAGAPDSPRGVLREILAAVTEADGQAEVLRLEDAELEVRFELTLTEAMTQPRIPARHRMG